MKAVSSRTHKKSQRGAALIELAIVLPLFLGLIFGILWLTQLYHAQSSLTAAVGNALRLGLTRGDSLELGEDPIPDIEDYINAYGVGAFPRLTNLLVSGFEGGNLSMYNNEDLAIFDLLGVDSLSDVSPQYIYALVYIKTAMRNSLGPAVRFPCDPDPGPQSDDDGSGCLLCVFRNPDAPHLPDPYEPEPPLSGPYDFPKRIAIDCSYQPGGPLIGIVHRLIGLASGAVGGNPPRIIMRRSKASEYF